MTGSKAATSRVTALDQARLLLAQAKAQKAAAEDLLEVPDLPPPSLPTPTHLAPVTSFDPDTHLDPDTLDPSSLDAGFLDAGSRGIGSRNLGSGDASFREAGFRGAGFRDPSPGGLGAGSGGREEAGVRLASVGGGVTRVPSVARVQQALDTAGVDRELPTHPAVSELLAGASLRGGSVYSVRGSAALVMALMAGPSAEGAWCGVVGVPSFGAEAARGLGVDLERLVLVPDPGRDWLSVVAALVDALTVVVVRPPGEVTPGEASRLAARLRTRGAMLIAYGSWPGSEARFEIESNTWTGLGDGEGLITARRATVAVTGRRSAVRSRRQDLWLPGPDGTVRPAEPTQEQAPGWLGRPADPTREQAPGWQEEWVEEIGAVG
ncbi:hypothetical protein [Kribbella jiaozuonensis]|uniref:hypothetical protein n=1 Tax=Kribbella jiaozuonensis TaxID=2575441 RepID=UPI001F31DBA9|nr:hypothetical protein [Kribbella jiaozuonensis]